MKTQHSLISPSNFERRMLCPGSLNAEKDLPETTSVYAEEGKLLHDRVNKLITGNTAWLHGLETDQKDAVYSAAEYYFDLLKEAETVIKEIHEKTFDLSFIYPEMKGTADSVLITFEPTTDSYDLHVIDYKFGKGVYVNAYGNYQLLLYCLGVISDPEIEGLLNDKKHNVHLHIVQPYKSNSVWSLNDIEAEDLVFSDLVMYQNIAKECYKPNAPRIASKKACQFCKAKSTCPALAKFVPDTKTKLGELSNEQIAAIYDNKDLITMYLKSVEEHIKNRLEQGSFMNYTLKPKLSNRKWNDDAYDYLVENLSEEAFEVSSKLIGITKAEKLLGKEVVNKLTIREEGANEIVKISDESKEIFKTFNND